MIAAESIKERLDDQGFIVIPHLVNQDGVLRLSEALATIAKRDTRSLKSAVYGARNLLNYSPIREFCDMPSVRSVAQDVLGADCFPVRGIFFDKSQEANWSVAWHQDLQIAVRERVETANYRAWSVKAGTIHVEPPIEVLEKMLIVRLHLDDCDESNGALSVLPGSHARGRFNGSEIDAWTHRVRPVFCIVSRGGAVLMRPLLLHSSAKTNGSRHRRVLHIEFAAQRLPGKLQWAWGRSAGQRTTDN